MTNTLHKNTKSCTGYPTPETDALHDKLDKKLIFMCERDELEAALKLEPTSIQYKCEEIINQKKEQ